MKCSKDYIVEGIFIKKNTLITLVEKDTSDIKVENEGILEIPEGKSFDDMPLKHFISLAKKIGKGPVSKAINNLARWNESKNPSLAKKAREVMDSLKDNKEWIDIPAKSE
jgi:hypothetical protein